MVGAVSKSMRAGMRNKEFCLRGLIAVVYRLKQATLLVEVGGGGGVKRVGARKGRREEGEGGKIKEEGG